MEIHEVGARSQPLDLRMPSSERRDLEKYAKLFYRAAMLKEYLYQDNDQMTLQRLYDILVVVANSTPNTFTQMQAGIIQTVAVFARQDGWYYRRDRNGNTRVKMPKKYQMELMKHATRTFIAAILYKFWFHDTSKFKHVKKDLYKWLDKGGTYPGLGPKIGNIIRTCYHKAIQCGWQSPVEIALTRGIEHYPESHERAFTVTADDIRRMLLELVTINERSLTLKRLLTEVFPRTDIKNADDAVKLVKELGIPDIFPYIVYLTGFHQKLPQQLDNGLWALIMEKNASIPGAEHKPWIIERPPLCPAHPWKGLEKNGLCKICEILRLNYSLEDGDPDLKAFYHNNFVMKR